MHSVRSRHFFLFRGSSDALFLSVDISASNLWNWVICITTDGNVMGVSTSPIPAKDYYKFSH